MWEIDVKFYYKFKFIELLIILELILGYFVRYKFFFSFSYLLFMIFKVIEIVIFK